jgi:hypothetical protein
MSAVAVIEEAKAGWPSAATADITRPFTVADLTNAEIRERMSGNLCRCACYPNIVDAVAEAVLCQLELICLIDNSDQSGIFLRNWHKWPRRAEPKFL